MAAASVAAAGTGSRHLLFEKTLFKGQGQGGFNSTLRNSQIAFAGSTRLELSWYELPELPVLPCSYV